MNRLHYTKCSFSIHHKENHALRGCIGTFAPTKDDLAQEIIDNAVAAAQDPRFNPISEKELSELKYKVDILSPVKPSKYEKLDPKKYGLLVEGQDGRRGLLLPDLPGIDTPEQQLHFCKKKAGLAPWEQVKLYTFTVERHEE